MSLRIGMVEREDINRINLVKTELKEQGVQYAIGSYVDVHGVMKAKVVPIEFFDSMVGGSELYTVGGMEGMGPLGPHEDECSAVPDLDSLTILPWDSRYVWLASDVVFHGAPYEYCSRSALQRVIEEAKEMGFRLNLGWEPEFYVLRETEKGLAPYHPKDDRNPTNAYDVEATLDSMPFLDLLVGYLDELGWNPASFDHEGGHGQFEIDFGFAPVLESADRFAFFRLLVKETAKMCGAFATFMPKPFADDFGSGAHFNMSLSHLHSEDQPFADADDPSGRGYSKLAYHFLAGVLAHARAITAVACPTVNSYKRLVPVGHMYDVTWAPAHVGWGYNNRSLMLRLPMNRSCVENRAVDLTANPYLAAAMHFAAGLKGIREELEPPPALGENAYQASTERLQASGVRVLPRTLDDALHALEEDDLAEKVFGTKFKQHFIDYKRAEWEDYHAYVSEWEHQRYLRYF